MNSGLKLVVVDDHPLARRGITSILSGNKNISQITESPNVSETLSILRTKKIDIAIVDLKLGKEDGLDLISQGKTLSPQTRYVILTSFLSRGDFFRAEEVGVDGYILKEAMAEDITLVINIVGRGRKYYDPQIITYYKNTGDYCDQLNQLTKKEEEVLTELGKGLTNDEIAKKLYISENTVKKHVSSILLKLNLKHRTQAALFINNLRV